MDNRSRLLASRPRPHAPASGTRSRLMVSLAALGLTAILGGCVAYPAYPGYGYGYGTPYYGGAYVGGGGGWHSGWHDGGWRDGGWRDGGWRR